MLLAVVCFLRFGHRSNPADKANAACDEDLRALESKSGAASSTASIQGSTDMAEVWTAAVGELGRGRRLSSLSQLATRSPVSELARLLDWAGQLSDAEHRLELRRLILARWAQSNGIAAMAYVQSLPEFERVTELVAAVLAGWAERDAPAAIQWFAVASKDHIHEPAVAALTGALMHHSSHRILELMRPVTEESARIALCGAFVEHLKDEKPDAAANLVVGLTAAGQVQTNLLGQVLPQWAQMDLKNALAWVQQLPPGSAQTAALIHLSYTWIEADAFGAAAFARDLPPGNEQFLAALVSQWSQKDQRAVVEWSQQLAEGPAKERVLINLASVLAQIDPRGAAESALRLPPGEAQQDAIVSVVSGWAANDPAAAAQWIADFPAGRLREYAIENVAQSWIKTDPVAAVNWLKRLPATERDTGIHAVAGSLVDSFPDLALQLAVGISAHALRERQIQRAAQAWLATDPAAARTWIEQSNLPAAVKQRLLSNPTS